MLHRDRVVATRTSTALRQVPDGGAGRAHKCARATCMFHIDTMLVKSSLQAKSLRQQIACVILSSIKHPTVPWQATACRENNTVNLRH